MKPILIEHQGDGITGFREIMIRQNRNEPRRKLLETTRYHFVVFLDEQHAVIGFELADQNTTHLLKWLRGHSPQFYGVQNVGKGYHNRDEVFLNGTFQPADVMAEITKAGGNIRPAVLEVLVEGINAYSKDTTGHPRQRP